MSLKNKLVIQTIIALQLSMIPMNVSAATDVKTQTSIEVLKPSQEIESIELEKLELENKIIEFEETQLVLTNKIKQLELEIRELDSKKIEIEKDNKLKTLKSNLLGDFTITAYDLSVNSCGRAIGHPSYGKTASGYSLKGMTREEAMSVAVDPKVIPLGSRIYLEFEGDLSKYNGIYTARDTGGAIKGKDVDLFFGDFSQNSAHPSVMEFGRQRAKVYLLPSDCDITNEDL